MNRNHLSDMMRLCSRREYCTQDIIHKLQLRELDSATIGELVDTLKSEGYVDDFRYARAFARDKSAIQGWGSAKIKLVLQRKNISSEIIAQAFEDIDGNSAKKRFTSVMETKYNALVKEDARKNSLLPTTARREIEIKNKLLRYGLSRGYSMEECTEYIRFKTTSEKKK